MPLWRKDGSLYSGYIEHVLIVEYKSRRDPLAAQKGNVFVLRAAPEQELVGNWRIDHSLKNSETSRRSPLLNVTSMNIGYLLTLSLLISVGGSRTSLYSYSDVSRK